MTDDLGFGTQLLVRAEAVRVIAEPDDDGGHRFKQALARTREARFVFHEFDDGETWPGGPIDVDWVAGPRGYQPTPVLNGRVLARVRRLEFPMAATGLLIGHTHRQEGIIATVAGTTNLHPPLRVIPLLEVALTPLTAHGKARLVLVHRNDAAVVPSLVSQ